jgi:hypothetical protein
VAGVVDQDVDRNATLTQPLVQVDDGTARDDWLGNILAVQRTAFLES